MRRLDAGSIDLTVTSPPYDDMRSFGGNQHFNFEEIASELYRVTREGGVLVWVVGDQMKDFDESGTSFKQALYFKEIGFKLFDTMIYLKPTRGAVGNSFGYWQSFEYMFVLCKGRPKTINLIRDRENTYTSNKNLTKRSYDGQLKKVKPIEYNKNGRRGNVWKYNVGWMHSASDKYAHGHPAIFPEKLAQDHIISWSNKGDIVYDPFMGSGTVAKMAIATGRHYLGSEVNKEYYEICLKRLEACQTQLTAHIE